MGASPQNYCSWTWCTRLSNEKPVDNSMTKLWITREKNMKRHQRPHISRCYPQSYPREKCCVFMNLNSFIHAIQEYNNRKQQQ